MKEITKEDCFNLREKFAKYCDTAQQYEFSVLSMINLRLDTTITKIEECGITNQKEARAMFRVVLKVIGEDYSEYEETEQ